MVLEGDTILRDTVASPRSAGHRYSLHVPDMILEIHNFSASSRKCVVYINVYFNNDGQNSHPENSFLF